MSRALLRVRGLVIDTPAGRPLFRDLTLSLDRGDRVAVVGRNGVGKSTLLRVLAGDASPTCGRVDCRGSRMLVPQAPGRAETVSPGQARRRRLEAARRAQPDLLLLDEPTHDLDTDNLRWLLRWVPAWRGGLIVVSHDRRLLAEFEDFFVVEEAGCRHVHGDFGALLADLEGRREEGQRKYVAGLQGMLAKERTIAKDRARRQRKKHLGRVRELGRCSPRATLNTKRSLAQESQARRTALQNARIEQARSWAKALRRALAVDLPLTAVAPSPTEPPRDPAVVLEGVTEPGLFENIDLDVGRERVAVVGPNGAGKSTLLEILTGRRRPHAGRVLTDASRIGYVAQNGSNWRLEESLIERLLDTLALDDVARLLRAHRFPFALADRPLVELSPGERLRAGVICVTQQRPAPDVLVLDEPTDHLDFHGAAALEAFLTVWTGGLVVASHDEAFLGALALDHRIELSSRRQWRRRSRSIR